MDIQINQKPLSLPEGATVADALSAYGARPPFAVALNGNFVARTQHAACVAGGRQARRRASRRRRLRPILATHCH
jgi:sulfur carrier protein